MVNIDISQVKTPTVLNELNQYFRRNSYVEGYEPSSLDIKLYTYLKSGSYADYTHLNRWYKHIAHFSDYEKNKWPQVESTSFIFEEPKKEAASSNQEPESASCNKKTDDDDDFDPFASSSEKEDEPVQKPILKPTKEKKKVINKSQLILEVKPYSIQTNLDNLEEQIRAIEIEGVTWSVTCKKLPLAFGLMKLQIGCVIIDDLVNTEDIINKIECLGLTHEEAEKKLKMKEEGEDYGDDEEEEEEELGLVQSAEIVSFNKL